MINRKEDCAAFAELFFDYIEDGGRDDGDENKYEELKRHLSECGECRAELEECRRMLADVRKSAEEVPSELHDAVMMRVRADAKLTRRRRFTRRAAGIAAVFVLVCGVYAAMRSFGIGIGSNSANDADMMAPEGNSGGMNAAGDIADDAVGDYDDNADADADADADENISSPDASKPSAGEDGDGLLSDGTPPDEAVDVYKKLCAEGEYDGGIVIMLEGDGAEGALSELAYAFDVELRDGMLVTGVEYYEKLRATVKKLEAKLPDSFTAAAYRFDGTQEFVAVFVP